MASALFFLDLKGKVCATMLPYPLAQLYLLT